MEAELPCQRKREKDLRPWREKVEAPATAPVKLRRARQSETPIAPRNSCRLPLDHACRDLAVRDRGKRYLSTAQKIHHVCALYLEAPRLFSKIWIRGPLIAGQPMRPPRFRQGGEATHGPCSHGHHHSSRHHQTAR